MHLCNCFVAEEAKYSARRLCGDLRPDVGALQSSKAALLRESQRAADLEAAIEGARRPSEGRSEETKAAAEATPAAAGDAVDIEAGMAAFEARVAALNSQIEAEQRP